jgi:hypothetical protein
MISEELRPLFEKIKTHLLTQNEKSVDEDGICMYRGLNGLMCAAGCLIPDSEYNPADEETSSSDIDFFRSTFNDDENELIKAFQMLHDRYVPSEWPYQISKLEQMGAKEYEDEYSANSWISNL